MLITNEGLFQIFSEGKQNNIDVLELLKRRNENKRKLIESLDKEIQKSKQQKKRGLNKLELKGREILKELGIRFNEQVLMFDKFLVDVLVKGQKVVIQWDGEYWHTKPKRVLLDKSQDAYLEKCGYKVLRITDKEIKNNIKQVYANITRTIQ